MWFRSIKESCFENALLCLEEDKQRKWVVVIRRNKGRKLVGLGTGSQPVSWPLTKENKKTITDLHLYKRHDYCSEVEDSSTTIW